MSKTNLNPEEAYNVLIANVHAPVFFEKLASVYGIKPNTQDEARELLLIAGELRNAYEQNSTKEANSRGRMLATARKDLTSTLDKSGYHTAANDNFAVKQAAEALATNNALVKEAALVYGDYVARQLQNS